MRMVRVQLVLAVLAASAVTAAAPARRDVPLEDAGRFAARIVTDREGLPSNSIMAVCFDAQGYLWVGTQDGAAYSNGRAWTTLSMPNKKVSNYIRAMVATPDGAMWFGSEGGLHRRKDGQWTSFDVADGLPHHIVRSLHAVDAGGATPDIVIGTSSGFAVYSAADGTIRPERAPEIATETVHALAVAEGADGTRTLLAGTEHGLLARENGAWREIPLPGDDNRRVVNCVLPTTDADGQPVLWIGSKSGLALLRDGVATDVEPRDGMPRGEVYALYESRSDDGSRTLWVATYVGLGRFRNGAWKFYSKASGLPTSLVGSLAGAELEHRTRTVWAGTRGGGLVNIETASCIAFDAGTGAPGGGIWGFAESRAPDGSPVYWVSTQDDVARLENGVWKTIDLGSTGAVFAMLVRSKASGLQEVLAGGRAGLRVIDGDRLVPMASMGRVPPEIAAALVSTVHVLLEAPDADGGSSLWVGTRKGLVRQRNGAWTLFTTGNGLPDDVVRSLCSVTGADGVPMLWVGTDFGGIGIFDGTSWRTVDASNGLPNQSVHGLLATRGPKGRTEVWAGTWGGAAVFDAADPSSALQILSDEPPSVPVLPNNVIYQIREDGSGGIYLCTNKGVARLSRNAPTDPSPFAIHTFTPEDGMPSAECNSGASMTDRDGRVWVGTVDGIAVFDPTRAIAKSDPSPLVIESVTVAGTERRRADARFAHYENDPSFEFALLAYDRGSRTTYRTQLVGFERAPTAWTANFRREFTNLAAGDYVFRVWGRDHTGIESGPSEFRFEIVPAIWQTWWARTLYVLLGLLLVVGLSRLRESRLRRRTEILEGKVARRTAEIARKNELLNASEQNAREANRAKSVFLANMSHELRTPLNAVLGFAQLLDRDRRLLPDQRARVDVIARSGEHLLELINDVLSISKIEAGSMTLNEQPFDIRRLIDGVVEMLRLRADAKGLRLEADIAPDFPCVVVGDEGKLRQILLNLLNNAVKFTDAGGVYLRATFDGESCRMEVRDTGRGIAAGELDGLFEPFVQSETGRQSQEGTGLGLAISRSYAQHMGGDITVTSQPSAGSVFTCAVRLPVASAESVESATRRVAAIDSAAGPVRVLVADDTPESRTVLVEMLRDAGFEVSAAGVGADAVEAWRDWTPHAVLVSVRMPGMHGLGVPRAIRAEETGHSGNGRHRTAILALSASVFEKDREAIVDAGCDAFLPKPFREAALFNELGRLLEIDYTRAPAPEADRPAEVASNASGPVTPVSEAVPRAMLDELQRCIQEGDNRQALAVVARIAEIDAYGADELRRMVLEYRFDELLERLDATG